MYFYLIVGKFYNGDGFGLWFINIGNGLVKVYFYQVFNDFIFFKDWFDVIVIYVLEVKDINWNIMSLDGYFCNQMIMFLEEKILIFVWWMFEFCLLERWLGGFRVRVCYFLLLDEYWKEEG